MRGCHGNYSHHIATAQFDPTLTGILRGRFIRRRLDHQHLHAECADKSDLRCPDRYHDLVQNLAPLI